jgi:hypothetical protein
MPVSEVVMSVGVVNVTDEDVNEPPPGKSVSANEPLIIRAALADPSTVNMATDIANRLFFM